MTSILINNHWLQRAQRRILRQVANRYSDIYLVGGTAISLLFRHRISEDLDFFTPHYSRKLHREIAALIGHTTKYPFAMVAEEMRKKYVQMAVYEFEVAKTAILKVDFVRDFVPLLAPRRKDGIASLDDIYYRKILAVIGWRPSKSVTGRTMAGGRVKTKDLFDIYYLSQNIEPLSKWFPKHFDCRDYERLAAWYLAIPKQRTVGELLDLVPGCDTRAVFEELDNQIIHLLNKVFVDI